MKELPTSYDLVVNTDALSPPQAAGVIMHAALQLDNSGLRSSPMLSTRAPLRENSEREEIEGGFFHA